MARYVILAVLGVLCLSFGPALSSPVRGHYRQARLDELQSRTLNPGEVFEFSDVFRANERACVIVEGDHKPFMNLNLKVFDASNVLVASDTAGGDCVAVFWYPPRTERYRIVIGGDGSVENELDIVVK